MAGSFCPLLPHVADRPVTTVGLRPGTRAPSVDLSDLRIPTGGDLRDPCRVYRWWTYLSIAASSDDPPVPKPLPHPEPHQ